MRSPSELLDAGGIVSDGLVAVDGARAHVAEACPEEGWFTALLPLQEAAGPGTVAGKRPRDKVPQAAAISLHASRAHFAPLIHSCGPARGFHDPFSPVLRPSEPARPSRQVNLAVVAPCRPPLAG